MTDHWHRNDANVGCTYTQFVPPTKNFKMVIFRMLGILTNPLRGRRTLICGLPQLAKVIVSFFRNVIIIQSLFRFRFVEGDLGILIGRHRY